MVNLYFSKGEYSGGMGCVSIPVFVIYCYQWHIDSPFSALTLLGGLAACKNLAAVSG